jgi:hypothetical protein
LLSEDQVELMAENDLLNDIKLRLSDVGLTMIDFGLDDPDPSLIEDVSHTDMEADEDAGTFYDESRPKLTADQERFFGIISTHIDNDTGGLYTIDAPGGSGKHFCAMSCWHTQGSKTRLHLQLPYQVLQPH